MKRTEFFGDNDVVGLQKFEDVSGMVCVLRSEVLAEEYRKPEFQLVRAGGGFGTQRGKIGTCFVVEFLADGERTRFERPHVLGVLKDELFEEASELVGKVVEHSLYVKNEGV